MQFDYQLTLGLPHTNHAGLAYFAKYIAFMDTAERVAMTSNSRGRFTAPR